jgi:hypothetical protein
MANYCRAGIKSLRGTTIDLVFNVPQGDGLLVLCIDLVASLPQEDNLLVLLCPVHLKGKPYQY